jgi:hypothetical protein
LRVALRMQTIEQSLKFWIVQQGCHISLLHGTVTRQYFMFLNSEYMELLTIYYSEKDKMWILPSQFR